MSVLADLDQRVKQTDVNTFTIEKTSDDLQPHVLLLFLLTHCSSVLQQLQHITNYNYN